MAGRVTSGEYSHGVEIDSDEAVSPIKSPKPTKSPTLSVSTATPPPRSSKDTLSLSGTLKREIKLAATDQGDSINKSGTVRFGQFWNDKRKIGARAESMQNLAVGSPSSPRNSTKFSFRSPKKKRPADDTISINRNFRSSNLRINEVMPSPSPFDDTVSMIEGMITDSAPIRQEEGIRDVIGRKNVVTLKKMVKLERPSGDRVDAKVLVLTPYRCQILGVKAPFKLEADFHFLEIKSMDSPTPDRLILSTHSSKIYFMQMIGTDDADHIIGRVALSIRTIFPSVPLSRILKASLEPLSRQKLIQQMLNQADQSEPGPCGNFSEMYRCVCNFLSCPIREEVEWDVDTIYLSQNCKELNLKDFDLPDPRDIIPIISVLNYNKWFEGLIVRNTKLGNDALDFILKAARNSQNLKSIVLEGIGIKGDFAQRLASNLVENKESRLQVLDLSSNPLEDKGLLHLSGALPVIKHANLQKLNISRAGLTAKGVNGLCQAFRSSASIMISLTHLNLSGNCLKVDDAEGLYNFLSTENSIVELDLSATECSVEMYVSALAKGCTKHLKVVNLSKNHFLGKTTAGQRYPHFLEEDYSKMRKHKDVQLPATFEEFFKNTTALQTIDFSNIKFPAEAVKSVMDGLLGNSTPGLEVFINFSSCELKMLGCQAIETGIGSNRNLVGLDLTDNSLDNEMSNLFGWLQQNRCLRELRIGRNFAGIKQKNMRSVMDSLVELVQEENSVLENLSIADSKLREFTHVLLGCLGSNTSLTSLDISGNLMGDSGARVLAKSLQINSRLRVLEFDRNNLSAAGFHELSLALEKNYTLRFIPYPVSDCVATAKQNPERAQSALANMQQLLSRNSNVNRASNDQQFRLQKVVSNTAQQVLDKVAEKVDDVINALEIIDADSENASYVISGKKLVKDAKNSKELLSDIYGLGMEKSSGVNSQLQSKITEMASQMDSMVQEHVKSTVTAMTQNAESQCPHIYEEIKSDLDVTVSEKQTLSPNNVRDHVIKSSGTEIVNKVSELNLSIATLISDKVTDSLLAALSQCNLSLTEHLSKYKEQQKVGSSSQRPRQSDDEVTPEKPPRSPDVGAVTDVDFTIKEEGKDLLPNMRKERAASVAKRRQRPVTTSSENANVNRQSHSLGDLPPVPVTSSVLINEEDSKKITDFGAEGYDPYANDKVKERKKKKREEKSMKESKSPPPGDLKEEEKSSDDKTEDEKEDQGASDVEDPYATVDKPDEGKETVDGPKSSSSAPEPAAPAAADEETQEKAEDSSSPSLFDDLPDNDSHRKLDHVTKNRPRGPKRTARRPPTKKNPEAQQETVDDFFSSDLSTTDFSATPSQEEERKLKEQEKKEEKKVRKIPGGVPMGGMPMISPAMLKKKKSTPASSSSPDAPTSPSPDSATEEEKSEEAPPEEEEKPATPRRPKGAMVMPGMGFGGNLLAEMKLKKLNKKSESDDNLLKSPPAKSPKPQNGDAPAPIGPGMLKKTSSSPKHLTPTPGANSNNNNSKNSPTPAPTNELKTSPKPKRKWGINLSHSGKDKAKDTEKSEKESEKKVALKPPAALKPALGRGKPPPLPSKPKPAFVKSGLAKDARARPVSEFIGLSSKPGDGSLVRSRAASLGKGNSKVKKDGE